MRFALAALLAALSLTASVSPATGAVPVTLGQLAAAPEGCANNNDWAQRSVSSGNPYVVPATNGIASWTVTSWSTNGLAGPRTMALKFFRPIAGLTLDYLVVGHDGPEIVGAGLNTFPASFQVKPGDLLGLHSATGSAACIGPVDPGEEALNRLGDGADGQQVTFGATIFTRRLNATATLVPTNTFTLGDVTRNKTKGIAKLTVNVPNPGTLALSGNGLKTASAAGAVSAKTVTAPGDVQLKIRAEGKKKRKLNENGKVKVTPTITFTPTGGDPNSQSRKLKLKKRL